MSAAGGANIGHTALPLVQTIAPSPIPEAGPVRFLYASSIIPTKGPDRLLRAFRALRADARLTIAGHSPAFPTHPKFADEPEDRGHARRSDRRLGPIPPQQMSALLGRHDVLVLPSIWPENSPLIVREATRAGLSVIASAQSGAPELAPHGTFIETDQDLTLALEAAIRAGRIRHAPAEWPSARSHAEDLLEGAYTPDGHTPSECATLSHVPGTSSEA